MFDRSIPVGGPAYLTFNGITLQMAADWKAAETIDTGEVRTNLQGVIEIRDETVAIKITFQPLSVWGNLATLFPYSRASIGSLIFGGTDKPVVIQTKAGKSLTFAAGAVTKSPKLSLTSDPKKQLLGEMEITCLIKKSTLPSAANAFYTIATSAYSEPTLDPTTILSPRFTTTYGDTPAAPFDEIETEDGVDFDTEYKFTPVTADTIGLVNYRVEEVNASVELSPINLTEADYYDTFLKLQGTGAGRGRPRGGGGGQFTCIGAASGDPSLTIARAYPLPGGLRFGKDGRIDKMKLQAGQKAVASVLQPLFTLDTVA